ncbi:hypothetical protein GQ457_05G010670 [Hibiscus cannabinus]
MGPKHCCLRSLKSLLYVYRRLLGLPLRVASSTFSRNSVSFLGVGTGFEGSSRFTLGADPLLCCLLVGSFLLARDRNSLFGLRSEVFVFFRFWYQVPPLVSGCSCDSLSCWNVRGLGKKETSRMLRYLNQKHKPCIIFLSETKQKKRFLERIRHRLLFPNSFYIEPEGKSGGLTLWWKAEADISILKGEKHMIDTKISINNGSPWFCSFLYGPPNREKKKEFWESITRLRNNISSPWCLMGDSNIIANQTEKIGGNFYDLSQANWFNHAINKCGLLEMPIKGGSYTWSNLGTDDDSIMEKLDRILFNVNWNDMFKRAVGVMEPAIGSDHSPIFCLLNGANRKPRRKFKFESKWLREDDCLETIKHSWNQRTGSTRALFLGKLKRTSRKLLIWSKSKYGRYRRKAEDLCKQIADIQAVPLTEESAQLMKVLKDELDKENQMEEMFWHQRSRVNWLKFGDRNSKFFHATTIQNRRRNSIVKIKDKYGVWNENEDNIAAIFQAYFESLFSKNTNVNFRGVDDCIPKVVTCEMNRGLCREVTDDEIKDAVFSMGALKSPGPDGFPGIFYHSFWDDIKEDLFRMIKNFFRSGNLPPEINKTSLVLIPKKPNPEEVTHFRLISLCNFSYKVISKILATRLKPFLSDLISPLQLAFVPGRQIQDNVIIAHEAFHAIKKRRKGMGEVHMNSSSHRSRPPNEGAWTPPPNEWIKANCDASWISCSQIAGIASVFRNESGSIVGGSTRRGCFSSVSIAEAEAVRSCLIYAKSYDFKKIIVESDNKSFIHRLNNRSFSDWKSASIERDICSLTSFFESVIFSFVRRSCNKVADWVARATRLNYCPRNWTVFLPPSLVGLM